MSCRDCGKKVGTVAKKGECTESKYGYHVVPLGDWLEEKKE